MLRVVGEIRPRYVFVENSPMLRTRGLETVLGGLASLGFDAAWCVLSAEDVGAPHLRKRMWILAERPPDPDADGRRCEGEWLAESGEQGACGNELDGLRAGGPSEGETLADTTWEQGGAATERGWWSVEPPVGRVVARGSRQLDRCSRLKALGNAQVPLQAATAFRHLKQILDAQRTG